MEQLGRRGGRHGDETKLFDFVRDVHGGMLGFKTISGKAASKRGLET